MESKNHFDQYTLGDTPAAIYLIDLLNKMEKKKASYILNSYTSFKEWMNELIFAYENKFISSKTLRKCIEHYRLSLKEHRELLIQKNYDITVINLLQNLKIAELRKIIRKVGTIKKLETSAIDRAKSVLKKEKSSLTNRSIETFAMNDDEKIEVEVIFNHHGVASSDVDSEKIKDKITSESLWKKSNQRMARRQNKKSL